MTVWEISVIATRTLMRMATRTIWTTVHTYQTPTRLTTTRTERETHVTMTTTMTASLMTRTTADWPLIPTSWTLMVSGIDHTWSSCGGGAERFLRRGSDLNFQVYDCVSFQVMDAEMPARMTLTKTMCLTSMTSVRRTLTSVRQTSASSRWFLWTPKVPHRLIPTGLCAIRVKSSSRLSTVTLALLLVSRIGHNKQQSEWSKNSTMQY